MQGGGGSPGRIARHGSCPLRRQEPRTSTPGNRKLSLPRIQHFPCGPGSTRSEKLRFSGNDSPQGLQRKAFQTEKALQHKGVVAVHHGVEFFTDFVVVEVFRSYGLKAVGESCSKPIEYYDNNLGGTLVLVDAMRRHGCKNIVFSSSATVYGTPERLPLDEDCRTGGTTNPYGTSKYFQEIIKASLTH